MGKKAYIGASVTAEEKDKLSQAARDANISLAELIKRRLFTPAAGEGHVPLPEMLTIEEMAYYLHVSPRKARSLCEDRHIPALKIGRQYRVLKSALDEFIKRDREMVESLPELLRPDEAARYLKVSRATIHRMIETGKLEALRVAKSRRIRRDVIVKLLEEGA